EPTPWNLAEIVRAGGLLNAGVGWYSPTGDGNYVRDGGHICTMAYFALGYTTFLYEGANSIGFRDPNTGEGSFTDQSLFNTEYFQFGTGETAVFDDDGRYET